MKNEYGYDYQKRKRNPKELYPYLSKSDEYIPNTHIGMYSILRNPKNESVYMGEERCQNIRKKTYDAILSIYRKYNSPSFSDLWNYNITAINACGLNYFATNPKIAPIAGIIQCIEMTDKDSHRYTRNYVSFAVSKNALAKYFKMQEQAKITGEEIKLPVLRPIIPKTKAQIIFGKEEIEIDDKHTIAPDRNAIYNRFDHWCKLNGVSIQEGGVMALQTLIKDYPIDGLNDLNYYNIVTELDKQVFLPEQEIGTERVVVNLSKMLYNKASNIMARYNQDPDNLEKGELTLDTYVNNALHLLNSNMPMKYRNKEKEKENDEK